MKIEQGASPSAGAFSSIWWWCVWLMLGVHRSLSVNLGYDPGGDGYDVCPGSVQGAG